MNFYIGSLCTVADCQEQIYSHNICAKHLEKAIDMYIPTQPTVVFTGLSEAELKEKCRQLEAEFRKVLPEKYYLISQGLDTLIEQTAAKLSTGNINCSIKYTSFGRFDGATFTVGRHVGTFNSAAERDAFEATNKDAGGYGFSHGYKVYANSGKLYGKVFELNKF